MVYNIIIRVSYLDSQDGLEMAVIADSPVECKQLLHTLGDMLRTQNVSNAHTLGSCVDELSPGIIARDVHITPVVREEPASERGEVREGAGEAEPEEGEEGVGGEGRFGAGEEVALLDVVAGEHREVRNGKLLVSHGRSLQGMDHAPGDDGRRERRWARVERHLGNFTSGLIVRLSPRQIGEDSEGGREGNGRV